MGERSSSAEAESVSRKPRKKGSILATLGIAGVLAGTSPAPAEAGQDFNWGQFARGVVRGYVQGNQRQEAEQRCLRTQIDSARELITNAENNLRFDTERANQNADSALESLSRRTDLTPTAREIAGRRIETDRVRSLSNAQSRFDRLHRIARERVERCRPRQW